MESRKLGLLDVPVVGMGTWKTFDVADPDERRGVVDAAMAAGVRLFDSSPMYGRAERVLGKLIEPRRTDALVATKVWTPSDAEADRQIANALSWYGGVVDVYQVHNLVAWEKRLATLEALKREGKARAIGVTHWSHDAFGELASVMRSGRIDVVQVPYSLEDRAVEKDILPLAERLGLGVLVMEPLGTGTLAKPPRGFDAERYHAYGLSTWPQVALKWILSDPRVTAVLPATTNPHHARDNAAAGTAPWFDAAERERVARLVG